MVLWLNRFILQEELTCFNWQHVSKNPWKHIIIVSELICKQEFWCHLATKSIWWVSWCLFPLKQTYAKIPKNASFLFVWVDLQARALVSLCHRVGTWWVNWCLFPLKQTKCVGRLWVGHDINWFRTRKQMYLETLNTIDPNILSPGLPNTRVAHNNR